MPDNHTPTTPNGQPAGLDRLDSATAAFEGRELKSDAEFDGLIQNILESIDAESPAESPGFPYRPTGPVYHVNPAIRGPIDFDLVEKLQAMAPAFGMSPAWGATYATGKIGNTVPKSGGYIRLGKPVTNVTDRVGYRVGKPSKPTALKCSRLKWGKGTDASQCGYKIWHPCHVCLNCNANALNDKAWRWDVGRGPFQTSIMVYGAANADEARKWTGQLAKAINIPNRASMVTPDGEILVVSADPLDADTIQRIRDFAAADHGNCTRPAMQCTIKSENVKGSDLIAFVKGNRTAQGEQRHVSWVNKGAAFAQGPVEDDFSLGDATPIPDDEPRPTEVVLSSWARQSRSWRKERNPAQRESMRLAARAEQAGLWCDGKNLITYCGPTRMLKQYAEYLAGRREYEAAWQYVAEL